MYFGESFVYNGATTDSRAVGSERDIQETQQLAVIVKSHCNCLVFLLYLKEQCTAYFNSWINTVFFYVRGFLFSKIRGLYPLFHE